LVIHALQLSSKVSLHFLSTMDFDQQSCSFKQIAALLFR